MTQPVAVDARVLDAVQLALCGDHERATAALGELWRSLPLDDDFHRCVVAHYLADLQTDPNAELRWDERALDAALRSSPDAFNGRIPEVTHESFLPSLYLNLAASHERIGQFEAARAAASRALTLVDDGPPTALGELTRSAITRICSRLGTSRDPEPPL